MATVTSFVTKDRSLQSENLLPSRGVAGSGLRPLPNIPHCCLPWSLDRVSVPMWPFTLSGRLPIVALVGRYLTNQLMGRELTPYRIAPLTSAPCGTVVLCGISTCFQVLSPCAGQIAHALLTRPPLESCLPSRRTSNKIPARLACVKHAASVRPEPGSNSDVQSFSSSVLPSAPLAKAPQFSALPRRLLSQNSDCLCASALANA